MKLLPILMSAAFALACDVDPPPPNTGGIDLDSGDGDGSSVATCPRGLVVSSSDYQSTNVSLIDLAGRVLSPSFISSASTSTGLSAPLSGDVTSPTERASGDEIVLLDRFPASVLTWVDLGSARVRAQLSVRTGFAANPHDYAELDATKAYVSRFEPNFSSGTEAFDQGNDILVTDPSVPSIVDRIDMMPAMAGEDPAYFPRADKLLLVGPRLYALLSGYARDFRNAAASRLVSVDTATDRIDRVLVLEGMHGCAGMALAPGKTELAIACAGQFAGDSRPSLENSGIVLIEIGDGLREARRFMADSFGDSSIGFGIAYAAAGTLVATTIGQAATTGAPARDDTLFTLDLATNRADTLLRSAGEPFTLGSVRCAPSCGLCFVTDAKRNVVHRFELAGGNLVNPIAIEVDRAIGLPPRYLGEY
jgi:hypothetical protein